MATLLQNKKAHFDYEVLETFEAGLELRGFEVKALRAGKGNLAGARVLIRGGEAFVVGMDIQPYQPGNTPADYDPQRTRKLLLNKKEIDYLFGKSEEVGLTIIPIGVYTKGRNLKIGIALVRGKKKTDKRQKIREREDKRKIEREMKSRLK